MGRQLFMEHRLILSQLLSPFPEAEAEPQDLGETICQHYVDKAVGILCQHAPQLAGPTRADAGYAA